MMSVRFAVVCTLFSVVTSKIPYDEREGKFFNFGYSYTTTEIKPYTIISSVPYSCVQVEPTLPPCRNARFLGSLFSSDDKETSNKTRNNTASSTKENEVRTTPLSWGEYLGLVAPTVTMDVTRLTTATVADQSVTVTFSVRGCRPSQMPLGLETCKISPTPAAQPITPTSMINSNIGNANKLPANANQIQGSQAEVPSSQPNVPTTSLNKI